MYFISTNSAASVCFHTTCDLGWYTKHVQVLIGQVVAKEVLAYSGAITYVKKQFMQEIREQIVTLSTGEQEAALSIAANLPDSCIPEDHSIAVWDLIEFTRGRRPRPSWMPSLNP